jgi:hypothetical protein
MKERNSSEPGPTEEDHFSERRRISRIVLARRISGADTAYDHSCFRVQVGDQADPPVQSSDIDLAPP